jgi:HEAT repeat protein
MESAYDEGALVSDLARTVITVDAADRLVGALDGASEEERKAIAEVLGWLPFPKIDSVLVALFNDDAVRHIVADAVTRRGVGIAPLLERAALSASDAMKRAAASTLGRIGSTTSVPTLISWLSEQSEVVIAAAGALGAIGDRAAFHPLLALLDYPEAAVRQAAVAAINSIGHPETERVLALRLQSDSARERESAARIAGYFGFATAMKQVVELCDDPDDVVRRAAVESLGNFDGRPAWLKIRETIESDSSPTVRAAAARALGHATTDESLFALVNACQDQSFWVRYYAIRSLARRGQAHADVLAAVAERATRDGATPVRVAAIEALAALGSASMLAVVLPLANDPDKEVACAAIRALGGFDARATSKTLEEAALSRDNAVQHAALDALAAQRAQDSVHVIRELIRKTRDDSLRRHAIVALGAIADRRAIEALIAFSSSGRYRDLVIEELAKLDERSLPALLDSLASASDPARAAVTEAVGRMRHSSAGRVLAAALDDPSAAVRFMAARALGRFDVRHARGRLDFLSRTDESLAVRGAARDALTRA